MARESGDQSWVASPADEPDPPAGRTENGQAQKRFAQGFAWWPGEEGGRLRHEAATTTGVDGKARDIENKDGECGRGDNYKGKRFSPLSRRPRESGFGRCSRAPTRHLEGLRRCTHHDYAGDSGGAQTQTVLLTSVERKKKSSADYGRYG